jgi:hypothetical protein
VIVARGKKLYSLRKAMVVMEEPVLPPNMKLARGTWEWTSRPVRGQSQSQKGCESEKWKDG